MSNNKEVKINPAWVRLMNFVSSKVPDGELSIKFANGMPIKLLAGKADIRFDKTQVHDFNINLTDL